MNFLSFASFGFSSHDRELCGSEQPLVVDPELGRVFTSVGRRGAVKRGQIV